jgi:hypothetical protein
MVVSKMAPGRRLPARRVTIIATSGGIARRRVLSPRRDGAPRSLRSTLSHLPPKRNSPSRLGFSLYHGQATAGRIAANIAKLPELLKKTPQ